MRFQEGRKEETKKGKRKKRKEGKRRKEGRKREEGKEGRKEGDLYRKE